ncbi:MAG: hypothetical protein JWP63_3531 [Candidatus Solibacter sp.]|nr:hypothetical protein [Candidatus Solibacter sp.]
MNSIYQSPQYNQQMSSGTCRRRPGCILTVTKIHHYYRHWRCTSTNMLLRVAQGQWPPASGPLVPLDLLVPRRPDSTAAASARRDRPPPVHNVLQFARLLRQLQSNIRRSTPALNSSASRQSVVHIWIEGPYEVYPAIRKERTPEYGRGPLSAKLRCPALPRPFLRVSDQAGFTPQSAIE